MRGLGTIINVLCVIGGGIIGCAAGNRIREQMRETLMTVTGVSVIFMGIGGTMSQMLSVSGGKLETNDTMMMIISLALGALIGELLDIEGSIERFGEWLKVKSRSTGDSAFTDSFVSASCTICIGAMAIIGSVQDGIYGDYSILATKGLIDGIFICVMAASQGRGCIFSALPLGAWQGLITVLAVFAGDFMPVNALNNLSYVGNILICCIGLNLIRVKHIRVANILPAIFVAAAIGVFR